jgi:hypothetical protein
LHFNRLETNATATSLDSGNDEDGHWVETWSFAMTLEDRDHMILHWTRIVNNVNLPLDKKISKFSVVEMGKLLRVASPPAPDAGLNRKDATIEAIMRSGGYSQILEDRLQKADARFRQALLSSLGDRKPTAEEQHVIDDGSAKLSALIRENLSSDDLKAMTQEEFRKTFTDQELEAMRQFFTSDVGQSVREKQSLAMSHLSEQFQARLVQVAPKLTDVVKDVQKQLKALQGK